MIFLRKKKKEKKIPMPRAAVGVASALGVYLTPLRPPVTASAIRRRPFYAEGCRRRRGGIRRGYLYAEGDCGELPEPGSTPTAPTFGRRRRARPSAP